MKPALTRQQLLSRKSNPAAGARAYTDSEIDVQLSELAGWTLRDGAIERTYAFRDYHDTVAFVNALAYIAHREDHHPDLGVHYDRCVVRYSTHDVGGLSENDFILAAKADAVAEG